MLSVVAGERDRLHQQSGGPEQEDTSAAQTPGQYSLPATGHVSSVTSLLEASPCLAVQGQEARLANMAEERVRRREEAAAREKAAQERRRTLEEERRTKLRELEERRKEQVSALWQQCGLCVPLTALCRLPRLSSCVWRGSGRGRRLRRRRSGKPRSPRHARLPPKLLWLLQGAGATPGGAQRCPAAVY